MMLFRIILPVADIEQATRFYAQVLGLPGERVSPGRHYFAAADAGGAVLACYSPREDGDAAEHGETWRPHPFQYVYFSTRDLGALRERCLSAGATAVTPIEHMPWGETLFYAVDPFGNPIAFVESGTEFLGGRPAP
ncbi:VOC family protein [Myxococcus sp. AM009]|uniref:VOC family protein n=1 Tax=Myxococcus sp. AM009 TaxID=2745137 RepID=UPI001594EB0E|nr:VOC family protein [Myxococcus sp. AM009]NVJ01078.1 VOC family protein [Myxococcus sp. AM009]